MEGLPVHGRGLERDARLSIHIMHVPLSSSFTCTNESQYTFIFKQNLNNTARKQIKYMSILLLQKARWATEVAAADGTGELLELLKASTGANGKSLS